MVVKGSRKTTLNKLLLISTILVGSNHVYASDDIVHKIVVQGNQRIESETVKNYIGVKPGDEFGFEKRVSAIHSLYQTQLFTDINLDLKDGTLYVTVSDAPLITVIEFRGNHRVKNDQLKKVVSSRRGGAFKESTLEKDIDNIRETYTRSGRYNVEVKGSAEKLENGRVKLVFDIKEGPKTSIKRIYFAGNEHYTANELKSIIVTKEAAWYRFMETNDAYDPQRFEYDKQLLVKFYQSVGFADCQVTAVRAELSPKKDHFTVTYVVEEGRQYNLGEVSLSNEIEGLDKAQLQSFVTVKPGDRFDITALDYIADQITQLAAVKGYNAVKVYPDLEQNPDTQLVDVNFVIAKADRVFVNKINITGNVKTEEDVIRREMQVAEGDLLNQELLTKSEANVRDLDFFETVEVDAVPTENAGRYDINLEVQEKSTASIGFDIGYSTMDKMFGQVSFLEKNLLGAGKILSAKVRKGSKKLSYDLTVIDPNFLDRDLAAGVSVFNLNSGAGGSWGEGDLPYSQKAYGGRVFIEYPLWENLSHEVGYNIKRTKLTLKDKKKWESSLEKAQTHSLMLFESLGSSVTSSVDHTLTYYQVDSKIIPKNGYILSFTQEYAGVGGDNKFLRHELEAKYYKSFSRNKYTLSFVAKAGDIRGTRGKKVRMNDRFNLGDHTMRGFEYAGIGPRDRSADVTLGGKHYYTVQTEFQFPIGSGLQDSSLSGILFTDIGGIWGIDMPDKFDRSKVKVADSKAPHVSVGAGVLWVTRFAPIRLDYAIPVHKRKYDDKQNWHFRMSTHF